MPPRSATGSPERCRRAALAAVASTVVAAAGAAHATADGPDHYRVHGVSPGHHLTLRAKQSTASVPLARIPSDATCLTPGRRRAALLRHSAACSGASNRSRARRACRLRNRGDCDAGDPQRQCAGNGDDEAIGKGGHPCRSCGERRGFSRPFGAARGWKGPARACGAREPCGLEGPSPRPGSRRDTGDFEPRAARGTGAHPLRTDGTQSVHVPARLGGAHGARSRHDADHGRAGAGLRRLPPAEFRRLCHARATPDLRPQRLRRDAAGALGVGREAPRRELSGRRPRQSHARRRRLSPRSSTACVPIGSTCARARA